MTWYAVCPSCGCKTAVSLRLRRDVEFPQCYACCGLMEWKEERDLVSIRNEFAVHMLNDEGKARAKSIAESFSVLLSSLEVYCSGHDSAGNAKTPDPRLMAIVRTKLEEACFFAKKAMASQASHVA